MTPTATAASKGGSRLRSWEFRLSLACLLVSIAALGLSVWFFASAKSVSIETRSVLARTLERELEAQKKSQDRLLNEFVAGLRVELDLLHQENLALKERLEKATSKP